MALVEHKRDREWVTHRAERQPVPDDPPPPPEPPRPAPEVFMRALRERRQRDADARE